MSFIAVVVFLLAAPQLGMDAWGEEPPATAASPVPTYTKVDLDRLAPRRGEGGVFVTGAPAAPAPADKQAPLRGASAEQGEEYWRREADKVRDRVRPLRERAELLRERIEEKQRRPGVRPYSDPGVRALQRDLARVLEQARELEERLEDRARRARALPGWLR